MMARRSTGGITERRTAARGTSFGIRFRVGGKRINQHIGYAADGCTRDDAERELAFVMEQLRRGEWSPRPEVVVPTEIPTFHEFSSDWIERRQAEGLRLRTIDHLRWTLTCHLLPSFARDRLDAITAERIDRFTQAKLREGKLAAAQINRLVRTLGSVLEDAVEYDLIARNPARGRRRKLPTSTPPRAFLEPEQVSAMLAAAGELDDQDRDGRKIRRPLLATLAYTGLRIGELLSLRWRDVDLATGRLHVRVSKTAAGVRAVDVQPELRAELVDWKLWGDPDPGDLVFGTRTGKPDSRNNVRRRVLLRAVERANENVAVATGGNPEQWEHLLIPERVSPHALRRSFASLLVADGEDPAYVMAQLGHTDPKMTLGLYAQALTTKGRRANRALSGAGEGDSVAEASEGVAIDT
jgi:integrase